MMPNKEQDDKHEQREHSWQINQWIQQQVQSGLTLWSGKPELRWMPVEDHLVLHHKEMINESITILCYLTMQK
jgi:hypothetical protein